MLKPGPYDTVSSSCRSFLSSVSVNVQNSSRLRPYIIILAIVVLFRFLTLATPDLVDTTEGRYATTAQIMLEKGDWVTPWIIYKGVEEPYLGKPPLHFWLIKLSYMTFGVENFAARLPGVLSFIAITATVFYLLTNLFGRRAAIVGALVFSTSTLAFFLAGAVLLDVTLTVGITLAIAGFALADRSRVHGYLCFAGLGLGILVKGPVAVIFAGMALGPWVVLRRWLTGRWPAQMRALPWVSGGALTLAIAVPWYIFAEIQNPGFLKYFIWNENLGRFFAKEYGDRFGSGHRQPRGTAWLMFIPAVIPWSIVLVASMIESYRSLSIKGFINRLKKEEWLLFGFLWAISCPLLLMGARQYTATYLMSSIPGFAFLMAVLWKSSLENESKGSFPSPRVTRIMLVTLGSICVIAPIVLKVYFAIHEVAFLSTVAFGIILVAFAIFKRPSGDSLHAFGSIALATVCVYALLIPCADIQISKNRSTREIIKLAERLVGGAPQGEFKVGFGYNLPFSASFYSRILSTPQRKITVSQVTAENLKNPSEHVILVRGKAEGTLLALDPGKQKLGQMDKWNVYKGAPLLPQ